MRFRLGQDVLYKAGTWQEKDAEFVMRKGDKALIRWSEGPQLRPDGGIKSAYSWVLFKNLSADGWY